MKYDMRPVVAKIEPWLKNYGFKLWSSKRQLDNGSMAFYSDDMKYAFSVTVPNLYLYVKRGTPSNTAVDNIMTGFTDSRGRQTQTQGFRLTFDHVEKILKDHGLDPSSEIAMMSDPNLYLRSKDSWEDVIVDIIKVSIEHIKSGDRLKHDKEKDEIRTDQYKRNVRDHSNDEKDKIDKTIEFVRRLTGQKEKSTRLNKAKTNISIYYESFDEIFVFDPKIWEKYDAKSMLKIEEIYLFCRVADGDFSKVKKKDLPKFARIYFAADGFNDLDKVNIFSNTFESYVTIGISSPEIWRKLAMTKFGRNNVTCTSKKGFTGMLSMATVDIDKKKMIEFTDDSYTPQKNDSRFPRDKNSTIPYILDKNIDIYEKAQHFIDMGLDNIAEV